MHSSPAACSDHNAYCPSWVRSGECAKNWSYMSVYCRDSCGLCPDNDSAAESCTDNNKYCTAWAKDGECTKNPDYMLKDCKKACEACEWDQSWTLGRKLARQKQRWQTFYMAYCTVVRLNSGVLECKYIGVWHGLVRLCYARRSAIMYVCSMYVCMYACMYVCMYVLCMYVCMYAVYVFTAEMLANLVYLFSFFLLLYFARTLGRNTRGGALMVHLAFTHFYIYKNIYGSFCYIRFTKAIGAHYVDTENCGHNFKQR